MKTLADISDILVGFAFKSSGFLPPNSDGIALLRGDNIQQGHIRWGEKTRKWPTSDYTSLERYHLALDDVVLAMDRPIVGNGLKMAWIQKHDIPSLLVQRVCRIRGKSNIALTNYIRYAISDKKFSNHIQKITTGANIPHISAKDIATYKITPPSINSQRKIVQTLSTYDDLIATNQRRIALLEEATRLIYREWFVHLRYPGHESTHISTGIPEGWKSGSAHEFINILSGGTPKTSINNYWDGDIPFFTPKDSPNCFYTTDTEKSLTSEGLNNCNSRLFPTETIFITARGTVGKTTLSGRPMAMNQSCYALTPKEGFGNLFLFMAIRENISRLQKAANGGVFNAIVVDTFKHIPFLAPKPELTLAFDDKVRPLFEQVLTLIQQNRILAQARDLLLPKLMSGQIDVSNIRLPDEDVVT